MHIRQNSIKEKNSDKLNMFREKTQSERSQLLEAVAVTTPGNRISKLLSSN